MCCSVILKFEIEFSSINIYYISYVLCSLICDREHWAPFGVNTGYIRCIYLIWWTTVNVVCFQTPKCCKKMGVEKQQTASLDAFKNKITECLDMVGAMGPQERISVSSAQQIFIVNLLYLLLPVLGGWNMEWGVRASTRSD